MSVFTIKCPVQTPDCIKTKKLPDQIKFVIYVLKTKCYFLQAFLSMSVQNMLHFLIPAVLSPIETHSAGQTVSLHQFFITLSMLFCIILFKYMVLKPYESVDKSINTNTDKSVGLCFFVHVHCMSFKEFRR